MRAIESGDIATLKGVPGVGAKTAERICVELRDRIVELVPSLSERGSAQATSGGDAADEEDGVRAELVSTLLNLQTQRAKAERVADAVIESLGPEAAIEDLVRSALRSLAR